MTRWLVAYGATLVSFVAIDAAYLGAFGIKNFRATLGDVMAPSMQRSPAIVFYLAFPIGLLIFALMPAFGTGRLVTAAGYGALFGLFTYGTYDLTNWATIRNWTAALSTTDMLWAAVLCAAASAIGFLVTRATVGIG